MSSDPDNKEQRLPALRSNILPSGNDAGRAPVTGGGDIIAYAMQQLTGIEGHQEINIAAQQEGLRLEAKRREGV